MIKNRRHAIQYGDVTITYNVTPSENTSDRILIHVHPNATVSVEVPLDCPNEMIYKAVRARARWIYLHLKDIANRQRHILLREYVSGESHLYLGKRYLLKVFHADADHSAEVKMSGSFLKVWTPSEEKQARHETVRLLLRQWYREHARDYTARRLDAMLQKITWFKRTPSWRLVRMKKQWGSCSPSRVILINPSLIKAPIKCIDYVIAHELCHLRELNHSTKFYRLLKRSFPAWEEAKAHLDAIAEQIINE